MSLASPSVEASHHFSIWSHAEGALPETPFVSATKHGGAGKRETPPVEREPSLFADFFLICRGLPGK